MLKNILIASVVLSISTVAASAASGNNGSRGYGRVGEYTAQSGGNGSPVAASSDRGSTDRSPPESMFASGPYGDGEVFYSRRGKYRSYR